MPTSTVITNLTNATQSNSVTVIVQAQPTALPEQLIYTGGGGSFFSGLQPDQVAGGDWYHGGYPPLTDEVQFYDCNNLALTNQTLEIVSDQYSKGLHDDQTAAPDYLWDEVFTTPIGLIDILTAGSTIDDSTPAYQAVNISSQEVRIKIADLNIVPHINDYIVVQRYFASSTPTAVNDPTTDDLNHLPIYRQAETFVLKLTDLSLEDQQPSGANIGNVWQLTLDKTFTFIENEQYTFVLLNRYNADLEEGLLYDTFQQIEVHRSQLLGDPYNNISSLFPLGRTNHLFYQGSEYLGLNRLLSAVIDPSGDKVTPFIVLDINDEIRDRIFSGVGQVEVHLPAIMLQDEPTDNVVLTNANPSNFNDPTAAGTYSELSFKDVVYGYVFYDLRIIAITHPELVTALGYNSNRNYTLPKPQLALGNLTLNTTSPTTAYFLTYRINSVHYDQTHPYAETIDFNWYDTTIGQIDNTNPNSQVNLTIPALTHLVDNVNLLGFEADTLEVIIGKYTVDANGVKTGFEDVVVMPTTTLKTAGVQNTTHVVQFTLADYDTQVLATAFYDLSTLYGGSTPSTLYTGAGLWFNGIVKYKNAINQYRLNMEIPVLATNWNATTNPTFEPGNTFHTHKLITEVGLLIENEEGDPLETRNWIYGKVSPPIKKDNNSDFTIQLSLDF